MAICTTLSLNFNQEADIAQLATDSKVSLITIAEVASNRQVEVQQGIRNDEILAEQPKHDNDVTAMELAYTFLI